MELILGLPPMSQYDAAATPMYAAFQTTPVLTPFAAAPARISARRDEPRRTRPAPPRRARMNFADADMTPEIELNEILWQSVHGATARMPPPVHAAFIRPQLNGLADDDDRSRVAGIDDDHRPPDAKDDDDDDR